MSHDDDMHGDKVADLFNQLFELELNWSEIELSAKFSISSLQEFVRIVMELAPLLDNKKISNSVWTLTLSKPEMRLENDRLMEKVELTDDERIKLRDKVSEEQMHDLLTVRMLESYKEYGYKYYDMEHYIDVIMKSFYEAEEKQLRAAGLNQSSIAIILGTIRRYYPHIRKHLVAYKSVPTGRYHEAVGLLKKASERIGEVSGKLGAQQGKVLVPLRDLLRAKSKVIGLATLWGDAVPLILCKDWGIASVISTTAGATIAAILPSGQRASKGESKATKPRPGGRRRALPKQVEHS
jgi:hypothetical protein